MHLRLRLLVDNGSSSRGASLTCVSAVPAHPSGPAPTRRRSRLCRSPTCLPRRRTSAGTSPAHEKQEHTHTQKRHKKKVQHPHTQNNKKYYLYVKKTKRTNASVHAAVQYIHTYACIFVQQLPGFQQKGNRLGPRSVFTSAFSRHKRKSRLILTYAWHP